MTDYSTKHEQQMSHTNCPEVSHETLRNKILSALKVEHKRPYGRDLMSNFMQNQHCLRFYMQKLLLLT